MKHFRRLDFQNIFFVLQQMIEVRLIARVPVHIFLLFNDIKQAIILFLKYHHLATVPVHIFKVISLDDTK